MQGVGEPDEEQEAGYPQQHLQLCPPSAPPSELLTGWLGYHPGGSAGQDPHMHAYLTTAARY